MLGQEAVGLGSIGQHPSGMRVLHGGVAQDMAKDCQTPSRLEVGVGVAVHQVYVLTWACACSDGDT